MVKLSTYLEEDFLQMLTIRQGNIEFYFGKAYFEVNPYYFFLTINILVGQDYERYLISIYLLAFEEIII